MNAVKLELQVDWQAKAVICRIFKVLGVPVYDADLRAREQMEHDQTLIDLIWQAFCPATYKTDGRWIAFFRRRLFSVIKKHWPNLNGLVHPRVRIDYESVRCPIGSLCSPGGGPALANPEAIPRSKK